MKPEPTYFFCIGATKAGTSWLHDHLSRHDECYLRSIKELHYFSRSSTTQFGRALRECEDKIALLQAGVDLSGRGKPDVCRQLADLRDWQDVLQLREVNLPAYRSYLTKGMGSGHLVGDMTPAYALLPAKTLQDLLAVGSNVRVVYLIRDPLERLWSHVRMIAKRTAPGRFAEEAIALLDRVTRGDLSGEAKGIVARGKYSAILPKLARVFDPKCLFVQFYEDLMTSEGVARLSAFLGIVPGHADFQKRVHGGVSLAMPARAKCRALAFLKPQYDYVAREYGTIPAVWRANMSEGVA